MPAWVKSYLLADLVVLYFDISGGMCFKMILGTIRPLTVRENCHV